MIAELNIGGQKQKIDLNQPLDISIGLSPDGPRAWYVEKMKYEPVMTERFTGSVAKGGAVNFRNVWFNPHGHGTHTETMGHIDKDIVSINQTLKTSFFPCKLVSLSPESYAGPEEEFRKQGDRIITKELLETLLGSNCTEAIVIRSLPNDKSRLSCDYSNTNPAYFEPAALGYLRSIGVKHLLTDLPSVDRELDGGKLLAHRAFWKSGIANDPDCTITEFIFAGDEIEDGDYMLNLQIAPFENDAAPSKPVLYKILES